MNVLPVSAYSSTSFKAMTINKKNPNVTNELRGLAEKATSLYEAIKEKEPVIDGIQVGFKTQKPEIEGLKLRKQIEGKDVELFVEKNKNDVTHMAVTIKTPNQAIYKKAEYTSKYYATDTEDLYQELLVDNRYPYDPELLKTGRELEFYSGQRGINDTIVKYAKPIIDAAEKIKEIFTGKIEA